MQFIEEQRQAFCWAYLAATAKARYMSPSASQATLNDAVYYAIYPYVAQIVPTHRVQWITEMIMGNSAQELNKALNDYTMLYTMCLKANSQIQALDDAFLAANVTVDQVVPWNKH